MTRTRLVFVVGLVGLTGCTEHGKGGPPVTTVDGGSGSGTSSLCSVGDASKLKFTRADSCGNDGGVEWCIPANDTKLQSDLAAISSSIRCAPGGGRAGCLATPNLLLCS